MTWLFWQSWLLLLVSFLLGAFLTWLFLVRPRRGAVAPSTDARSSDDSRSASHDAVADQEAADRATSDGIVVRPRSRTEAADEHVVTMAGASDDDTVTPAHGFPVPRHGDTERGGAERSDAERSDADRGGIDRGEVGRRDIEGAGTQGGIKAGDVERGRARRADAKHTDAKRADVASAETKPADVASAETKPADVASAETKPADAASADAARADTRHADATRAVAEADDADTIVIDADVAAGRHARPVASADFDGGVLPRADGTAPTGGYVVKAASDSMMYHAPGSPAYGYAKVDVWFRDAETAEDAGFRPWNWRDRTIARRADGGARTERADAKDQRAGARAAARGGTDGAASTNGRANGNGHGNGRANGRARNGTRRVEEGAYPGSAKAVGGGAAPSDEFVVKASEDSMLYHTAESPAFASTHAELWFRSEADARKAGFAPWRNLR